MRKVFKDLLVFSSEVCLYGHIKLLKVMVGKFTFVGNFIH